MSQADHWEKVYESKPTDRVGWYRPHLETSLAWIRALELDRDAPIIDVGGGASTLVDDLLDEGYTSLTVLDLSQRALAVVQERLAERAALVDWLVGDITEIDLPADGFVVWHDRAVFHFLTEAVQQARYRAQLERAVRPGGHVIIGAFSPQAPPRCSGLPVQRYDRERLQDTLGDRFELVRAHEELHVTPGGVEQMYLYCQFRC